MDYSAGIPQPLELTDVLLDALCCLAHEQSADPKTEDAQLLLADVEALLEAAERYEDLEY